jgi:hypothetical protein
MELTGPDGAVAATVDTDELRLSVDSGGTTVVESIDLSVGQLFAELHGADWTAGGTVTGGEVREIDETYEMPVGKAAERRHRAVETTLTCTHPEADGDVEVDVRVATDGVATRYRITGEGRDFFFGDFTTVRPPMDAMVWLNPLDRCHEGSGRQQPIAEAEGKYSTPGLLAVDGQWCLLGQAGVDGDYPHARLDCAEEGPAITYDVPTNLMNARYPVETPWRVAIVGDLADVVESTLVEDLVGGPDFEGPVEPGRVAWSWWSEGDSPEDFDRQREYIDYAAERGWEYVLVDAGWQAHYDEMPALVEYASERDVGVFVWTHWTDLQAESEREEWFAEWHDWGVSGVKIDFMDHDDQGRMAFYDSVAETAAEYDLMLNFHGSVVPSGLQRRHPNVMTYEGVYGAEWYKFKSVTPEHNCVLPFTRNVVGPMDYTPVTFSAEGRHTTAGHELALSVVFESPLQHLADSIDSYADRPLAESFLEDVPVTWAETRLVGGHPGTEATVARRGRADDPGDAEWFLGSITAGPRRIVTVDCGFLDGEHEAEIVRDDGEDGLATDTVTVTAGETLDVMVARNGGFVARFE